MNKFVAIGVAASLVFAQVAAARPAPKAPNDYTRAVMIDGAPLALPNPLPTGKGTPVQNQPGRDVPIGDPLGNVVIGEDYVVGYTWYDYQANGTIGKMIAKDADGGLHFAWMCGYNANNDPRHMVYNFLEAEDLLNAADQRGVVDGGTRSGYGHVAVMPFDGRGGVFYHVLGYQGAPDANYLSTCLSTDWQRGVGAFDNSYVPAPPDIQMIWPKGAFDLNNVAHVFSHEYYPQNAPLYARVFYQRGVPDLRRDPITWRWYEAPIEVGVVATISQMVSASTQSGKVVLAWHQNRVYPNAYPDNFGGLYQRNNDIQYIVSEDGENWDWNDVRSITRIIPPDPDLLPDREKAYGDTFRPYCDIDIQFDPWNDDLYAVFAAPGFWEEPDPQVAQDDPGTAFAVHNYLWFWNSVEDTLTMVADGWYTNWRLGQTGFRPGGWRVNADRGSIAFDPDNPGRIFVVWVSFPKTYDLVFDEQGNLQEVRFLDFAGDTSASSYGNAEIMVSISNDYGLHWKEPINITQTRWQGNRAPNPGECKSENWVSAAYVADGALHIMYILDTDAGGLPQNEGTATNCPVIYHHLSLEDLYAEYGEPEDMEDVALPREGFMFHNYPAQRLVIDDVRRDPGVPVVNGDVTVTATVKVGEDAQVQQVVLYYYLNENLDDQRQAQMQAVNDTTYRGVIPGQANGTRVWYYVYARDNTGLEMMRPTDQENYLYAYTVRPEGGLGIYDVQYRPPIWGPDYSPYVGYEVTVEGVVTTPASFARQYGAYAIQDSARRWNGVFVRGINDELQVGDRIRVTGIVMERDNSSPEARRNWEFATYIQVSAYEDLGHGEVPEEIEIQDVADLMFRGRDGGAESLEGVLVKLYGFWVATETGFYPESSVYWPITDSTYIGDNLAISHFTVRGLPADVVGTVRTWRQGTFLDYMSGVFTENFGYYALAPRTGADLGPSVVRDNEVSAPLVFRLNQPRPNPFNASTRVSFDLPRTEQARLAVYDLKGRLVADILKGELQAGRYDLVLNANRFSAGVYVLRLETDSRSASTKLVLMR